MGLIHAVSRTLPTAVLDRDELIALGGLLTQISGALLTLTERLTAPVHHYDRTRATDPAGLGRAILLLRKCQNSYQAANASAREFHAEIRR